MNRRQFLLAAGGVALVQLPFAGTVVAATQASAPWKYSLAGFKGQVGRTFDVAAGPKQRALVRLTLEGVDVRPSVGSEQFTARFTAPSRSSALSPGIYEFRTAATGPFQLRIQPAKGSATTLRYVADFNLLAA